MNNLSINQALSIWSDLEQCYYNDNKYGSDTAELYAYRFMPNSPGVEIHYLDLPEDNFHYKRSKEAYLEAAKSLYNILVHFAKVRDCKVLVEYGSGFKSIEKCEGWLLDEIFCHRIHVKIVRKS